MVVTAAVIAFLLVLFFGEKRTLFQQQKTIYLRFPTAPGVSPQTPVRKNGVLIGRVVDVELLEEGDVMLTAKLETRYPVRRNEAVRISTASLFGDAVLEFVPGSDEGASTEVIADGEFIADGIVATDPLRVLVNLETKLSGAISSIEVAGNEVTLLARNLNTIVGNNQDQFQRVMQKSELAMEHFRSAMETVDEVIGDPEMKANLKRTLRDLPELFDEARSTLTQARTTLDGFQKMSARADQNLQNLEKFTGPLAERGELLAERMESAVVNVDSLLDQLVQFSSQLNSREGTLGQLLYDKELYDRLKRTVSNLEDASRRVRPILDDVRVMTHKLATDPRQLGLKGALDRRPLGVGSKKTPGELSAPAGMRFVEEGVWIEDFTPPGATFDGVDATEIEIELPDAPASPAARTGRIPWRPAGLGPR